MRKFLTGLLLILCMGIAGCSGPDVWETGDTAAGNTVSAEKESSPAAANMSQSREEETLRAQSELLKKLYQKDGDNTGAYRIPLELEEGSYVTRMECFEDKLLVLSSGHGLNVYLFNLDSGELIESIFYELGYEDMGEGGFLEDGTIWLFVPARQKLYYFDQELKETDFVDMAALYHDVWYSDYQKNILWTQDYEGEMLYFYRIDEKAGGQYDIKELLGDRGDNDGCWWSIDKTGGGYAYLTITMDFHKLSRYRFSAVSGQIEPDELASTSAMSCGEGGSFYQFHDKYRIVDYACPDQVMILEGINEKEQIFSYRQQYLFACSDNMLNVYDCSSGLCYTAYRIAAAPEEDSLWNDISVVSVRQGMKQVLFSMISEGKQRIVLCDLNQAAEPEEIDISRMSPAEVREKIGDSRNEIGQKHGISMITLEEAGAKADMSGYTLWDNIGILDELDASEVLLEFMNGLPSGLTSEMQSGQENPVEICFCGTISGDTSAGNLDYAGAYVTFGIYEIDGEPVSFTRMVCDVSLKDALLTNFAHEWFHLMEDHIWETLQEDWEGQWAAMSPEDAYFYEYNEYLAFDENLGIDVYVSEPDMEDVYFIDGYSRTFPKEDRARIFENLYMAGSGSELPACFESAHIRQKVVYLCELIRSCYPSADTAGKNVWEQGLCEEDWEKICENRLERLGY
ncbi:MAG: hypothetical protein SO101_12880 [Lachnospiraceae bacterium]|nr:hypothetical protein [Lachnospiraceae bacterium]